MRKPVYRWWHQKIIHFSFFFNWDLMESWRNVRRYDIFYILFLKIMFIQLFRPVNMSQRNYDLGLLWIISEDPLGLILLRGHLFFCPTPCTFKYHKQYGIDRAESCSKYHKICSGTWSFIWFVNMFGKALSACTSRSTRPVAYIWRL